MEFSKKYMVVTEYPDKTHTYYMTNNREDVNDVIFHLPKGCKCWVYNNIVEAHNAE